MPPAPPNSGRSVGDEPPAVLVIGTTLAGAIAATAMERSGVSVSLASDRDEAAGVPPEWTNVPYHGVIASVETNRLAVRAALADGGVVYADLAVDATDDPPVDNTEGPRLVSVPPVRPGVSLTALATIAGVIRTVRTLAWFDRALADDSASKRSS